VSVLFSIMSSKRRYDIDGTKLNLAYKAEMNVLQEENAQ
jgi:hypothetical protein